MNRESVILWTRAAVGLGCLLASFAAFRSEAYAQWLPDRNYTEGPGIRAGNLEVHPGVAVRGGYDDNVFRADGDTEKRRGSAILAVTPHLNLTTLGNQRVSEGEDRGAGQSMPALAFKGGLSATYFHYFIDKGPRNLEVDTDLQLSILPRRPVSVDVGFTYARSIRPFAQGGALVNSKTYIYDSILPTARLVFGSRSQVLTGYVGYAPRITLYESSTFDFLNSFQHGIQAGAAWKFLPSTALIYDAQLDLQDYQKNIEDTAAPIVFSDNKRFRTRLGINGAFTRSIALRAMAGYTAGFYDRRALDDFEDVIGEAVLTYRFGAAQTNTFTVGYNRDVQTSALGGWIRADRASSTLSVLIGRAFQLAYEVGVAYVGYGRLVGLTPVTAATPDMLMNRTVIALGDGGDTKRNDVRIDGSIHGEYRATNWLAFTADFNAQALLTDFDYNRALVSQGGIPDPARYYALAAFGGVRLHY